VCFGPTSLGRGPLNILCEMAEPIDWEAARLTTGSTATRDGTFFRIAERIIVSLSETTVWRPTGPLTRWRAATMLESLSGLAGEVRMRPARGGLQALIPVLTVNVGASPRGVCVTSPLLRMAMRGIEPLAAWLETRLAHPVESRPAPTPAIDALIGLGPGLTPSGDDFLGGILVTLHHLGIPDVAGDLAREVLARAEQRTNGISHAHLAAAANGEGLEPLIRSLKSQRARSAKTGTLSVRRRCDRTHVGLDALAGVAFAAATVARVRAAHEVTGVAV